MSGHTHATCSPLGWVAAAPPGQYGRSVRAAVLYAVPVPARTSTGKTPNWL